MEVSRDEEISQVSMERPHLVILGAGASRAAFPEGEATGHQLPLMNDFIDIVPVKHILRTSGLRFQSQNFEDIYAELAISRGDAGTLREALEEAVFGYFSSLRLPDTPTIYDHLIWALRPKDVIATFNWDPFLIQAVTRRNPIAGHPKLLFLHGNVLQGYCKKDEIHGIVGAACSSCGQPLDRVRLLYPVRGKNYQGQPAIRSAWSAARWALESAFMVTVFGYGAPQSDQAVIQLFQNAWGDPEQRNLEQFEFIDIRDEQSLLENWEGFIHTHHYEVHQGFFQSWIANHPRRTGEAYWNQYFEAAFIEGNPVIRTDSFRELREWYEPLIAVEQKRRKSAALSSDQP
jgi:hypothetical protein